MNILLAVILGAFLGVLGGFLVGFGIFYWYFRKIKRKAIKRIKKQENILNKGFDFNTINKSYSKSEGFDPPKSKWEFLKGVLLRPLVFFRRKK